MFDIALQRAREDLDDICDLCQIRAGVYSQRHHSKEWPAYLARTHGWISAEGSMAKLRVHTLTSDLEGSTDWAMPT